MVEEVKLRECPFCGESKYIHLPIQTNTYYVECQNCNANISCGYKTTREQAVTAWNTRAERNKVLDEVLSKLTQLIEAHPEEHEPYRAVRHFIKRLKNED